MCLMRTHECYRFDIRRMTIHLGDLGEMARVGLPAGLQGTLFSLSNVIIQSTINSFGSIVVAGNAASANLEGFMYVAMNAFYHAALTFSGQNYGARQYKRTRKVLFSCQVLVIITGLAIGTLFYIFRNGLLNIYAPGQPEVVAAGITRLLLFCFTYFICGIMDVMVGGLRGLGYSVMPMIVSLLGACAFRIFWVAFVFPLDPTLENLYLSYPISWTLTAATHLICYLVVVRKLPADGELPPPKKARA
jgi:Na+-driven multidrug efflux pump